MQQISHVLYRNIDDVDKTMDEINEQTQNMKQIQEALSTPIGAAADFDECKKPILYASSNSISEAYWLTRLTESWWRREWTVNATGSETDKLWRLSSYWLARLTESVRRREWMVNRTRDWR
ncbi:hypothetical protein V6N13_140760 [Hibiscus sabdariffa]